MLFLISYKNMDALSYEIMLTVLKDSKGFIDTKAYHTFRVYNNNII